MESLLPAPTTVRLGLIRHEPIEVYHNTAAVSKSKLELIRPRPSRFYRRYVAQVAAPTYETAEQKIGRAFETLLLEGEKEYNLQYAVAAEEPNFGDCRAVKDRTTKEQAAANKAKRDKWEAAEQLRIGAKTILSRSEHKLNLQMLASVRRNHVAMACLAQGEAQITLRCKAGPILVQVRPDWLVLEATPEMALLLPGVEEGDAVIIELKTCGTLDPKGFGSFAKVAEEKGYYRQRALYVEVATKILNKRVHHFFLAVEKNEPCEAVVSQFDEEACELGRREVGDDLQTLVQCATSGEWPGLPQDRVITMTLNGWHVRQANARLEAKQQPQLPA